MSDNNQNIILNFEYQSNQKTNLEYNNYGMHNPKDKLFQFVLIQVNFLYLILFIQIRNHSYVLTTLITRELFPILSI